MKKIIHCVYIDNFFPELWNYTLPTIKLYANRINAELNIITERKFPDWHINYEKMQVWKDGKDADLNFLVDADVLIHPYFPDIEQIVPLHHVAFQQSYNASRKFKMNDCFMRDGRDIGVASNIIVSGKTTHCLWEPLDMLPEDGMSLTLGRGRHGGDVDEYTISYNIAKYGLKCARIASEDWQKEYLIHIGTEDKTLSVNFAEKIIHEWNKL